MNKVDRFRTMDDSADAAAAVGAASRPRGLVPWIIYLPFFAVLSETVFNVATPVVARQFALTPSGVSWLMTIFVVCFGVGSVIFGRLSDLVSPGG